MKPQVVNIIVKSAQVPVEKRLVLMVDDVIVELNRVMKYLRNRMFSMRR